MASNATTYRDLTPAAKLDKKTSVLLLQLTISQLMLN